MFMAADTDMSFAPRTQTFAGACTERFTAMSFAASQLLSHDDASCGAVAARM
jgi:hypothetical protein